MTSQKEGMGFAFGYTRSYGTEYLLNTLGPFPRNKKVFERGVDKRS